MKKLMYLFFIFCLTAFVSCENKHNNIIVKEIDKEKKRYEFYCNYSDTISAYSYVFYCSNKQLAITINCDRHAKEYLREEELTNDNDTNAASPYKYYGDYKLCSYKSILTEFSECLKESTKYYKIKSLTQINVFLPFLQEIAVEATQNLLRMKIPQNMMFYTPSMMEKSIWETSIVKDLNAILQSYGLKVVGIKCDGYAIMLNETAYIQSYLKSPKGVKSLLGINVYFIISEL